MTDLSTLLNEVQIKKIDYDNAIRYKVVGEKIDLRALRVEKENLEAELAIKEPTQEELAVAGQMIHPFFTKDDASIQARIDAIDVILGGK